jgi:hypothetical protein
MQTEHRAAAPTDSVAPKSSEASGWAWRWTGWASWPISPAVLWVCAVAVVLDVGTSWWGEPEWYLGRVSMSPALPLGVLLVALIVIFMATQQPFVFWLIVIVSLALGVLIAARTTSQRTAMMAALVGTMMPNVLLSGIIFPIASMPGWLRAVSVIVPARWFIVIARGIMLEGVGLANLWLETAVLALMTVVLLTAAVRSFSARLA